MSRSEIGLLVTARIMDDVLRLGGERESGKWPRRLAATVVVAVLAAGVVRDLRQDSAAAAHHPATTFTAGPVQLAGLGSSAARLLNETGRTRLDARAERPRCQRPETSDVRCATFVIRARRPATAASAQFLGRSG